MTDLLLGKTALITGAASGIGRAAGLTFSRAGARVVLADVDAAGGEETARQVRDGGGEALFISCDVSKPEEVEQLVQRTMLTFGRLDCAFNNAGIEGQMALTAECTLANWERTLAVNLTGTWLCMRCEIPQMLAHGGGAIVNMSSVAGLVGFESLPAYVASKHGVIGLTRCAALEYAKSGVRVNAVCPGAIRTPMLDRVMASQPGMAAALTASEPVGRLGLPEEVAAAAAWLCSDAASFVTGHAMAVDGGWVAR